MEGDERDDTAHDVAVEWRTRDGAALVVRPIAPDDFAIEKRFIAGLSTGTGYRRLLSPRIPQDDEIERFTHIDPTREAAWIAVTTDNGVAGASSARPTTASSRCAAWPATCAMARRPSGRSCSPTRGSDAGSGKRCSSG